MDDGDNRRIIENTNAANFFNDKISCATTSTGPQISFSRPQQSPILPQSYSQPSENRPSPSSNAQYRFERESQRLPPIFPHHGSNSFGHSNTPPISPFSPFSPRTGFPGPVLPSLRSGINDRDGRIPFTPISPMHYTPLLNSPMDLLPSPMLHVSASSQHDSTGIAGGTTSICSPMDLDVYKRSYGEQDINDLNRVEFSRRFQASPLSPSVNESRERVLSLNEEARPIAANPNPDKSLPDMMTSSPQSVPLVSGYQKFSPQHLHLNDGNRSLLNLPESPTFEFGTQNSSNVPEQQQTLHGIHPSGQAPASSAFQNFSRNPASIHRATISWPAQFAEGSYHGSHKFDVRNLDYQTGSLNSGLPFTQQRGTSLSQVESDRIYATGDGHGTAPRNMKCSSSGLRVLPSIIIDRPLIRKADILQQRIICSAEFASFVLNLKESHRMEGEDAVGGTMRRRSDLIKPVTRIEDYGYPNSDRGDVHKILDTTPGLSRENVEYLKNIVLSQLETVKRGAREALYQFSVILVDQLRYRVMKKEDILSLQVSVVDRFVVARNCILQKYTQYVRSRRWIENMSTNQRRGCLTHKQNNILRMWLYRNFSDPYPDDDCKDMMMEETQLSLEQVNNWLINARSRFWKPSMDYFDRVSLERKMAMLIRHRINMSTEEKIKAASSGRAMIDLKRRKKRQVE